MADTSPGARSQPHRRGRTGALRWLLSAVTISAIIGFAASPAGATWSLVAADPETGEVGAAIASCVPADVLGDVDKPLVPIVVQPGVSAAVTQAQLNIDAPRRIVELTATGATPAEIIGDLTSQEYDELAPLRQHAIVSVTGDVAASTGSENSPEALDAQGDAVSVQGNILVDESVVNDALAAFEGERAGGGSLADALVAGLDAGSAAGGDQRCGDQTALFAQLVVAGHDDVEPATVLTVLVDQGGENPVSLLTEANDSGRLGLIDARSGEARGGGFVRVAALVIAGLLLVAAVVAWRRGIGSIAARR